MTAWKGAALQARSEKFRAPAPSFASPTAQTIRCGEARGRTMRGLGSETVEQNASREVGSHPSLACGCRTSCGAPEWRSAVDFSFLVNEIRGDLIRSLIVPA